MEAWKDVPGYEGLYEVSSLGRVRSLGRICSAKNGSTQTKRARILTQEVSIHGYCRIRLYDANGVVRHHAVHRLVLEAFVGKDDREVNHKNEIKTDNRLENLEYCTSKENCNYGTRNGRLSKLAIERQGVPVLQISKDTGKVLGEYSSRRDAQSATGIPHSYISAVCRGKKKTAGGYIWRDKCQTE